MYVIEPYAGSLFNLKKIERREVLLELSSSPFAHNTFIVCLSNFS